MVADIWSVPDVVLKRSGSHARAPRMLASAPRPVAPATYLLAALLLLVVAPPRPAEGQVLHVYDRLNRLRATVDPAANDSAIWTYDARQSGTGWTFATRPITGS